MKLLVLADNNDFQWSHGPGASDVLIACGDLYDSLILDAARQNLCSEILAVKGNHDFDAPFPSPIMDLHLQVKEIAGIRFGGLNGSWKYKARGSFLYDQGEVEAMLSTFPPVDVLISHNSPRHVHDKDDGVHYGFEALNAYIERANPRLLIHGHQHENAESQVGATHIVGVYGHSILNVDF